VTVRTTTRRAVEANDPDQALMRVEAGYQSEQVGVPDVVVVSVEPAP